MRMRKTVRILAALAAVIFILETPLFTVSVNAAPNPGAGQFVTRLYNYALGRDPDAQGYADWTNALLNGDVNAAEVATGILNSDEYVNLNADDTSYVTTLYHVFFNRDPDATGLSVWVTALESGTERRDILMGFINSVEWANLCATYGVYSGSTSAPTVELVPTESHYNFVSNLFKYFTVHNYTDEEINTVATDLVYLRTNCRQVAYDLIFSDEYVALAKASTPARVVETFFKAFNGRNPLPAETSALCDAMNGVLNIDYLYNYFVNRNSFAVNCVNRGLMPGRKIEVNTSGISDDVLRNYFSDAAFVGNSVTAGFPMYFSAKGSGLLGDVQVYARVSYSFLTDMNSVSGYMLQYNDMEMRACELLSLANVQKVFICMGTNDLVGTEPDAVFTRYVDYVNEIINTNPGIRVFIVSTTPRCNSDQTPGLTNEKIDQLNVLMSEYCAENGLDFIDINTPLKNGTDELFADYSSDGYVHMNNSGYTVWSNAVTSYVRSMLASERHIYRNTGT